MILFNLKLKLLYWLAKITKGEIVVSVFDYPKIAKLKISGNGIEIVDTRPAFPIPDGEK